MPNTPWKQHERRIARSLRTRRTPLSGGNSGATRSDTLHPQLYIECKSQARSPVNALFRQVRRLARAENKLPVLALHQKGWPGSVAVVDWDTFVGLWNKAAKWNTVAGNRHVIPSWYPNRKELHDHVHETEHTE